MPKWKSVLSNKWTFICQIFHSITNNIYSTILPIACCLFIAQNISNPNQKYWRFYCTDVMCNILNAIFLIILYYTQHMHIFQWVKFNYTPSGGGLTYIKHRTYLKYLIFIAILVCFWKVCII